MTWSHSAYINEARGAVHTGDGTQVNLYLQALSASLREQARQRPRTVAKDDRERLYQRFVPPGRFQRARQVLHTHHTVLLSGRPGSGLRAAALMLLHELPEAEGSFHELPDTADDDSSSPFDNGEINGGDRLLLDLSGADETRYLEIQNQFSDFRGQLMGKGAHLTVVLPHHLGYLLRSDLRPLTADIERPSARRVLTVHLRHDGIVPSAAELDTPELTAYLARAPLRDVADLADRIRRNRDSVGTEEGFPRWLGDALAMVTDQTARVAGDLSTRHTGTRRALLLALAMFHDTAPATVFSAGTALLEVLRHPPDERPRLEHSDFKAELKEIGAETQPSGRVRFSEIGYDRAVRDHFWTYLPDLRLQLCDWIGKHLEGMALSQKERDQVIARFSEQGLRTGRPEDLLSLATRWTGQNAPQRLMPDAVRVLVNGLGHDRYGRFFRQQIYDWSKNAELSQGLKRVLVLVCTDVMAQTHPDQAMVRLHHLARRERGPVGAVAQRSLLAMARTDNRLYRLLLSRLNTGMTGSHGEADTALFLAMADATRVTKSGSVRAALVSGWTGVLRQWPWERWQADADRWLTACEDDRYRDPALDVLVTACAGDSSRLGGLYRVARGWARARTDHTSVRTDITAGLLQKINSAQGFEPLGVSA